MSSRSSDDSPTPFVFEDARHPLLPSWQATCFTINVIMGSGFLGVPSGFLKAGVVLGPAVLAIVSVMQWLAACQLAQVASRANALILAKDQAATLTPTLTPFARLQDSLLQGDSSTSASSRPPSLLLPSHTSYEILMLTRLHLGRWPERATMVGTVLYMVGTLWALISVFASSLAATVPMPWLQAGAPCDIYKTDIYGGGCITLYYWWVLTFAMATAVLLALDLREQAAFQTLMTGARALIILAMVLSLTMGDGRADFGLPPLEGAAAAPLPLARWSGLGEMVPIGVFCQLFQIGVPSLVQPLGRKRDFPAVFGHALVATLCMYTSLGLAAVYLFRDDVDPSCNLNWQAYTPSPTLALCVALFPALDCLSVFPLNAVFLSNNVLSVLFQKRWHAGRLPRRTRYGARLLCCVPPFACAFAFPSLAKALSFTGIVGILLPFIVTPVLHRASLAECTARWGAAAFDRAERDVGYGLGPLSSPVVASAFGFIGCALLAYCVACGLLYGF